MKCSGVNITFINGRMDLISPDLPDNYEDEVVYEGLVHFNCTIIPGRIEEQRSQQCVADTDGSYRLVGDSLECKSKFRFQFLFSTYSTNL